MSATSAARPPRATSPSPRSRPGSGRWSASSACRSCAAGGPSKLTDAAAGPVETNSVSTLIAHARAGLPGVTAHTWLDANPLLPGLRAIPLIAPEIVHTIGLVTTHRDRAHAGDHGAAGPARRRAADGRPRGRVDLVARQQAEPAGGGVADPLRGQPGDERPLLGGRRGATTSFSDAAAAFAPAGQLEDVDAAGAVGRVDVALVVVRRPDDAVIRPPVGDLARVGRVRDVQEPRALAVPGVGRRGCRRRRSSAPSRSSPAGGTGRPRAASPPARTGSTSRPPAGGTAWPGSSSRPRRCSGPSG